MTYYVFYFKRGSKKVKKQFFCGSEEEAWMEAGEWAYSNGYDDFWKV